MCKNQYSLIFIVFIANKILTRDRFTEIFSEYFYSNIDYYLTLLIFLDNLQWWVDTRRHQAVLCCGGAGGVEVWHPVWLVWHTHNHTGGDLLQYQEEGGLAHTEDAGSQLYSQLHARRHATERTRQYHEGVQIRTKVLYCFIKVL